MPGLECMRAPTPEPAQRHTPQHMPRFAAGATARAAPLCGLSAVWCAIAAGC